MNKRFIYSHKLADNHDIVTEINQQTTNVHYEHSDNNINRGERVTYPLGAYVNNWLEKISRRLRSFNTRTVSKINYTINSIRRSRDKTKPKDQINIVCRLKWADCRASYVGEPKLRMFIRITEHRKAFIKKIDDKNVIGKHMATLNHKFDFDNPKILDKESCWKKRLTEVLHIDLQNNAID